MDGRHTRQHMGIRYGALFVYSIKQEYIFVDCEKADFKQFCINIWCIWIFTAIYIYDYSIDLCFCDCGPVIHAWELVGTLHFVYIYVIRYLHLLFWLLLWRMFSKMISSPSIPQTATSLPICHKGARVYISFARGVSFIKDAHYKA